MGNLRTKHRNLVFENLTEGEIVEEIIVGNEVVFLIKEPGRDPHG